MSCTTDNISINCIIVSARIRKETGQIDELAADIKERGLINPVTVMECGTGKYRLIAGLRRLEACKILGHNEIRASVLSPMDAERALEMEYAENIQRKNFTIAERLEYADKISAVEKAKSKKRQIEHLKSNIDKDSPVVLARAQQETGKTRDLVARKAGFTSGMQYERAVAIAKKAPELLDKIDAGENTIYNAYLQAMEKRRKEPVAQVKRADIITRAGHERLMKNQLYSDLWNKCKKAVADANIATTELEFRKKLYENQIRNYQDNVNALSKQCETLEAENAELRTKLETKGK